MSAVPESDINRMRDVFGRVLKLGNSIIKEATSLIDMSLYDEPLNPVTCSCGIGMTQNSGRPTPQDIMSCDDNKVASMMVFHVTASSQALSSAVAEKIRQQQHEPKYNNHPIQSVGISEHIQSWGSLFTLDADPTIAHDIAASTATSTSTSSASASASFTPSVIACVISHMCLTTLPCLHDVRILLSDGTTQHESKLSARDIWSRYGHIIQLEHSHHEMEKRKHFVEQQSRWRV